nr:MAG TPA: Baseplate wedge protein [Caudoviricetes sp.]
MRIENFDARHLGNSKRFQAQMTNWFKVIIGGVNSDITLLVQNVNLPEESNPPVELPYGNTKAKVPGQTEYSDNSLSIIDAMQADIEQEFVKWRKTVYDPETGKMGWVSEFKRDMTVYQYGPDGTCIRGWRYEGCWPSQINYGEMTGDSSDKKLIQVTITYDRAVRLPME